MIVNIIDRRSNVYNTRCNVAYEPAYNDNRIHNSTKYIKDCNFIILEYKNIQIVEAIERGNNLEGSITLHLYDF